MTNGRASIGCPALVNSRKGKKMTHTPQQLEKMTKRELAEMHVRNGGLMGLSTYLKWTKDELVSTVLTDESYIGNERENDQ